MIEHWYITVAATREWLYICGMSPLAKGETFDRAAKELDLICRESARLKKDEGHRQIYEAKTVIGGKIARLEIYVSLAKRPEGDAPQVVRVRRKGGSRSGRPQGKR